MAKGILIIIVLRPALNELTQACPTSQPIQELTHLLCVLTKRQEKLTRNFCATHYLLITRPAREEN